MFPEDKAVNICSRNRSAFRCNSTSRYWKMRASHNDIDVKKFCQQVISLQSIDLCVSVSAGSESGTYNAVRVKGLITYCTS